VEGLDFVKTFAPVTRLEAIKILLAFVAFKRFKLYQMDVKNAFLNGVIQEEVYVRQRPGFKNLNYPPQSVQAFKGFVGLSRRRGLGMLGLRRFY
jgi:hypothetical protein